jgi:broad specificity phosphatase PhoE
MTGTGELGQDKKRFVPSLDPGILETDSNEGNEGKAEKLGHKPVTTIDVRRHSDYDGGFPDAGWGKPTEEEQQKLGHLTEQGIENATRVAREIVGRRLDESGDDVDFLVIASPTHWLGDEQLGQRAIETGKIYSDEIKRQLEERGLSSDHLINTTQPKALEHEVGDVRVGRKMVEAQIFDDPAALDVIDELRAKYGGQGTEFWDAWYAGDDSEALDSVGAESSTDAADRADKMIEAIVRYGKIYNTKTGRSLAVIVLTHHEILQPYALHKLGVSQQEFVPGKNDGFEIRVEDERAVVSIAGHEIERTSRRERRSGESPDVAEVD